MSKTFTRDQLGVAVRSALNNTRDLISPIVALQLGVNKVRSSNAGAIHCELKSSHHLL